MPKAMFTQGLCVLLRSPVEIGRLEPLLKEFEISGKQDANEEWAFSGPALSVAYLPVVKGYVSIDVVDQPWPDRMGDPVKEPMIFGAWSMGFFGPFAFPGGLQRAVEQCWSWDGAKECVDSHQGFVRIRSSYSFGGKDNSPILPIEYAALPELEFVTRIVESLLELPEALCYFNPSGEMLRDRERLQAILEFDRKHNLPAIDAWTNVRLFKSHPGWLMMDTVGCAQLDIPDSEAYFREEVYDCGEIDNFLRNISLYVLQNGQIIRDGDTMDGPSGVRWQCRHREESTSDPPRNTLRWVPLDGHPAPKEIST